MRGSGLSSCRPKLTGQVMSGKYSTCVKLNKTKGHVTHHADTPNININIHGHDPNIANSEI